MIDEKKLLEELTRKGQSLQKHLEDENELFSFGLKHQLAILKNIIRCIVKQPKIDKWIPCNDRLPEDKKTVLICGDTGWIKTGWYESGCWWTGFSLANIEDGVIAWQPLPDPYKPNNQAAVQKGEES